MAVVDGASDEQLARAELAGRSAALAAGLSERGIGRGDLVAVAMPSSACLPLVALGVWRAGAALAPISPIWTALETAPVLARLRPRIAVALGQLVPVMRGGLAAARLPIEVLVHDVAPETTPCTPLVRALVAHAGDLLMEPEVQPSDLAAILLSSGADGPAEGVRLTHGDLASAATQTTASFASGGTIDVHSLRLVAQIVASHAAFLDLAAGPPEELLFGLADAVLA